MLAGVLFHSALRQTWNLNIYQPLRHEITRGGSWVSSWRPTRWMERRTVTPVKPQSSQLRFTVQCRWNCDKLETRWTKFGDADPSRGSCESYQHGKIAHVDLLYKFQLKIHVFFHIQSALVGLHWLTLKRAHLCVYGEGVCVCLGGGLVLQGSHY